MDQSRGDDDADGDARQELEDDLDAAMLLLSDCRIFVLGGDQIGDDDGGGRAEHASEENDEDAKNLEVLKKHCLIFVFFFDFFSFERSVKYFI